MIFTASAWLGLAIGLLSKIQGAHPRPKRSWSRSVILFAGITSVSDLRMLPTARCKRFDEPIRARTALKCACAYVDPSRSQRGIITYSQHIFTSNHSFNLVWSRLARAESPMSPSVLTSVSHFTGSPFPSSHSCRILHITSLATPWHSLFRAETLLPVSSSSRRTPNAV